MIALDRDPAVVGAARESLAGLPVRVVLANYRDTASVLAELGVDAIDGTLLDLGLSSDQLADEVRRIQLRLGRPPGLAIQSRRGPAGGRSGQSPARAALADLIYKFGEERFSRRIARRIVEERQRQRIDTAQRLAEIVRPAVPRSADSRRIDAATRTFQALRIAVNDELGALDEALATMPDCLAAGGRWP